MPLNPNDPILAGRVPLVDQRGILTRPGFYFLMALSSSGASIDSAVEAGEFTAIELATEAESGTIASLRREVAELRALIEGLGSARSDRRLADLERLVA